jgi:hypothetical protein
VWRLRIPVSVGLFVGGAHGSAGAADPAIVRKFHILYDRVFRYPFNADAPESAVNRFLRWQIASRVVRLSTVVPYVDDTKLVVGTGMSAATLTIYIGLAEFEV